VVVHASRDKISFDQADEVDEDGHEEEVFALQGVSSDSDDEEDDAGYLREVPDDERGSDGMQVDSDADSEPTPSKSKRKPSKAARENKTSSSTKHASDSEEEEDTWGRSKGVYYASNAAELDSEDEEANELEEQEALRLQAKACEAMCDEDFGLGDVVEGDAEPPEAMYACSLVVHSAAQHSYLGNTRRRRIHL